MGVFGLGGEAAVVGHGGADLGGEVEGRGGFVCLQVFVEFCAAGEDFGVFKLLVQLFLRHWDSGGDLI